MQGVWNCSQYRKSHLRSTGILAIIHLASPDGGDQPDGPEPCVCQRFPPPVRLRNGNLQPNKTAQGEVMKIKLALAAILAFATVSAVQAEDLKLVQDGKLMVATEGTYPPFSMLSPAG